MNQDDEIARLKASMQRQAAFWQRVEADWRGGVQFAPLAWTSRRGCWIAETPIGPILIDVGGIYAYCSISIARDGRTDDELKAVAEARHEAICRSLLRKEGIAKTCDDCGKALGSDKGPPEGWQLEDGRTVCHACCAADTRKKLTEGD